MVDIGLNGKKAIQLSHCDFEVEKLKLILFSNMAPHDSDLIL